MLELLPNIVVLKSNQKSTLLIKILSTAPPSLFEGRISLLLCENQNVIVSVNKIIFYKLNLRCVCVESHEILLVPFASVVEVVVITGASNSHKFSPAQGLFKKAPRSPVTARTYILNTTFSLKNRWSKISTMLITERDHICTAWLDKCSAIGVKVHVAQRLGEAQEAPAGVNYIYKICV